MDLNFLKNPIFLTGVKLEVDSSLVHISKGAIESKLPDTGD